MMQHTNAQGSCDGKWDEKASDADAIEFHDCTRTTGHQGPCQCACGACLFVDDQVHEIAGYAVPIDPMDDLQCDSCQ